MLGVDEMLVSNIPNKVRGTRLGSNQPMFEIEFLIGLLGAVALLAQLAGLVSVLYPIFLVLGPSPCP